jgi:hypothetical protein
MSGDRQTDNFSAVDQASRAAQPEPGEQEEQIQSEEDVIETMRRQLAELEERDRLREQEITAERRRAAEERGRRERAEAAAAAADTRVAQVTSVGQRSVDEARLGEITTALEARKGQMEALKSQYQAAFAEGDGGKMAAINSDMAMVGAQITQLEAGKGQLERRQAEVPAVTQAQPTPAQIREQMTQGLNNRERDWVNDHPEYFDNPGFQKRVQAASLYAQEVKGLSRDSQDYIDLINRELGFTEQETQPPPRQERQATPRDSGRNADASPPPSDRRMVTAPAGGAVPNTQRGGSEPVYLSREEKEMARVLGVPEAEYAANKRDLQKEGLIGPGAANRR